MLWKMYLMNADFLELRFKCPGMDWSSSCIYINSKLKLSKTLNLKYYNSQFFNCYDILEEDKLIGYLYTKPIRSPFYSKNEIVVLRYKDITLYSGGIKKLIENLAKGLKNNHKVEFTYQGISRLDISYDTEVNIMALFKQWYYDTKKISFKNRGKLIVNGTGDSDTQTNIGSLKSREKTIIMYDKTNQMVLKEKPFLKKIYEDYFGTPSVYRVELRLYSNETRKLTIDPMSLDDKNYLESIFKMFFIKLVDFRTKRKNSNITSQAKLLFLPLSNSSIILTKKILVEQPETNNHIKYMVKKIIEDSHKEEFKEHRTYMTALALKFVKEYHLQDWLNKKLRYKQLKMI
jgi:hypothetical protein